MTAPRRTAGRTQQPAKTETKPENPRVTTTPAARMAWKIEIALPSGGTISVNASNNIDLLAAYNGLLAAHDALQCGVCQGTDVRLTHKKLSNEDGEYDQFVMCCKDPNCRGMYSFSIFRDAPDMLVESFNEKYRGWYAPSTQPNGDGNGNGGSKPTSARGSQSSSRSSRQSRQQVDEQEEENEDPVPF